MGTWINHRRLRWKVTVLEAASASCLCPGVSWYYHSVLFLNKWELFWNLDMERVGGSEVRGSVSVSGTNSVWWNLAVSHWAHEKQRCSWVQLPGPKHTSLTSGFTGDYAKSINISCIAFPSSLGRANVGSLHAAASSRQFASVTQTP